MGKAITAAINGGAWFSWLLDFAGWVILLAGVAGMQNSCGSSAANFLLGGGSAGYQGPVSCDVLFSYPWWITFYNIFVWILSAITLARGLDRFRPGIIALLAISIMQSMETANTYLSYDSVHTTSGVFEARARVATAGAIIKAIAQLLMVALIGTRDESTTVFEKPVVEQGRKKGIKKGMAPLGPPPVQSALEPHAETIGVRPGRVAPPATEHPGRPTTTVSPV